MGDPARAASILIEAVTPELDGGRSAVKRIAGESLRIEADVLKEGHDVLAAVAWWRKVSPASQVTAWQSVPMRPLGNDRWAAEVPLPAPGRIVFTVEAWPDLFRSWVSELERKVAVGREVKSELLEGGASANYREEFPPFLLAAFLCAGLELLLRSTVLRVFP